jgi:hypothetical protein
MTKKLCLQLLICIGSALSCATVCFAQSYELGSSDNALAAEIQLESTNSSWSKIPELSAYKYRGNLQSNKFHRPGCNFGDMMAKGKRIYFHYRRDAIDAGMKPCNWCLPRWWKTVHCRILRSNLDLK